MVVYLSYVVVTGACEQSHFVCASCLLMFLLKTCNYAYCWDEVFTSAPKCKETRNEIFDMSSED